ncbi:hypothetical protein [Parasphingorhabdus sp.]|uniref:hypothetical protein n=1 Tax=Parasphingorhabdus sp. TaxID=2709688 RepID=UPI002F9211F6
MDDYTIARVIHVASIVLWMGGVAFVTMVAMPAIRRQSEGEDRLSVFHGLENGFAWQAKIWVLLAGASGFWMTWRVDLWDRFLDIRYWWMHAMVILWLIFMVMLFIAEPLFLHRRMKESTKPGRDFARMEMLHRVLTLFGIITIMGAVAGSHGLI